MNLQICVILLVVPMFLWLLAYLHGAEIIAQLTQEQQVTVRQHGSDCKQTLGDQSWIQKVPIFPLQILLIVQADAHISGHPEHES